MSRQLSNWLTSYLEFTEASEAPEYFHFWTGISVIAGALRRHTWIDMGLFEWTPNFYIVFVAPPGIVSKSTTANIGMNLLRAVPGIHFGPDAVTWQSLVQSLSHSTEAFEHNGDYLDMSSITIVSSEFGTFLNPSDREMVDVLVSLWDGQKGTWEKHTKTSGNDKVKNPWINIVACTTPAWIQGNFPEYMIGGGFTSRTIFIYGEEKRNLRAYPGDHLAPGHAKLRSALIRDLESIASDIVGPFEVTRDAKEWGTIWYKRLHEENKDRFATDRFAGYLARKQTHMHKLAMVLSSAEGSSRQITARHLSLANDHLTATEHDMKQVFKNITAPDARAANVIVEHLRRIGTADAQSLQRQLFQNVSPEQFRASLIAAEEAGFIKKLIAGNKILYAYNKEIENGSAV